MPQSSSNSHDANAPASRRILIHALNYAPEMIGCAKYTTELAEFLSRQGHSVEVITAPPHYPDWRVTAPYKARAYSHEWRNQVRLYRCPMILRNRARGVWRLIAPLSFAISALPLLASRFFLFRPHVVLIVEPTLFSAPAALLGAKISGARAILHVQDLEMQAAFNTGQVRGAVLRALAMKTETFLLKNFDAIITISHKMRMELLGKGLACGRVKVLRNWVASEAIYPQDASVNTAYRRRMGVPDHVFVALYSGSLGVKQALPIMLEAARLLKEDKTILFIIVGDGPAKQALMDTYGDLPNVRFWPLQPIEELNALLNLANLHILPQDASVADLVLPSKLGGMLASGRPIAATVNHGTELYEMLKGVALISAAGDAFALAASVRRATKKNFTAAIARGMRLARTLSAASILPQFEAALLEAPPAGNASVARGEGKESKGLDKAA